MVTTGFFPTMSSSEPRLHPKESNPQGARTSQTPDGKMSADTHQQDFDCKCGKVKAADRVGKVELGFQERRNGSQDIEKIGVNGQCQVGQPGKAIAMKSWLHEGVLLSTGSNCILRCDFIVT